MSRLTGSPRASSQKGEPSGPCVRDASLADVQAVAAGVAALLEELGGRAPDRPSMETAARAVISDPSLGCVLVGEDGGTVVGVLAASWQTAIHAGGRYALIQDLWVAPAWRRGRLASSMVQHLVEMARELEMTRIEVGLPPPRFDGSQATEAFYLRSGFRSVGLRMRLGLA
jgi:GNAT superfamily N-acetyltransferase